MTKNHVNQRILDFLKSNPRYSYNAPTLFKMFNGHININSIRCELRRLCESKKIIRENHGFYRIKLKPELYYYLDNPPTLLHGIMVSMRWNRKLQNSLDRPILDKKNIPGITFENLENDINHRLQSLGFKKTGGPNRNRLVHCFYFENDCDRLITVTVHFNGRLDIYLNCSKHPVNYFEFRDILNYAKGMVSFLGPFWDGRVVQFGLAKDFREVQMSDCSCLTLRGFLDSWFRVYNKENYLRVEQHIRCDLSVGELIGLFERMFLPMGNGVVRLDGHEDVV